MDAGVPQTAAKQSPPNLGFEIEETHMQTLDQLIENLQKLKAEGLDGTTRVGIPSFDNDGKSRMIQLDVLTAVIPVAKDEYEKGWTLCRKVARGGVQVLVLAG